MKINQGKQKRSARRRELLMKVAAKLFLKRGYDGVSVDEIVQRAGGSKSTVYQAFGGKCGLFITTIESLCQEFNAPLRDLEYSGLTLRESLEKLGCALVALISQKEYIALHRLVIAEAGHCPEVGHAWYAHGPSTTLELIANLLTSHLGDVRLRPKEIDRAAAFLHDGLVTDIQHRLLSGVGAQTDHGAIESLVRSTVQLFLLGYLAEPQAKL
jgi:AcrR family transcriptional regulator